MTRQQLIEQELMDTLYVCIGELDDGVVPRWIDLSLNQAAQSEPAATTNV